MNRKSLKDRCNNMFKSLDIQKDIKVVGLDGKHVGAVDHLETADRIILSKDDEGRRPASSHLDRLGRLRGPEGPSQQAVNKSGRAKRGNV
jgi:hypothetical protein